MAKLADIYSDHSNGVLDLRGKIEHPILFRYSEIFDAVLIDADVSAGRLLPFFKISEDAPFFLAARAGLQFDDKKISLNAVEVELDHFYKKFQPKSVDDWFLLDAPPMSQLKKIPPWSAVLPWRARSVESFRDAIENGTKNDNEKEGLPGGIEKGWAYCGPVTEEKLNIEAKRINELIYSFRQKGYQRSFEKDGDIVATALVNAKNDWRWLVTSGYHRACVLAAMGVTKFPVRVNLVVREDEMNFWPHLLSGFYTKEMVKNIFNKIFQPTNDRI